MSFVPISFDDFKGLVRERLKIAFDPAQPYKLCDIKPALGAVHEREIADYPFFGYGDIDVIYGDISRFYSKEKFADLDVISTHPDVFRAISRSCETPQLCAVHSSRSRIIARCSKRSR